MDKLTVDNLYLNYGAFSILKDVSLRLKTGEIVVLLGPSGSGKTTLLRAIAGLETPEKGRIEIDGKQIFNGETGLLLPAEKRDLGLVFQSYALWPHRSARDNVGYGLKLRGMPKAEIDLRVTQAMTQLGLGDLMDRFPHELSGGQQQRAAIARALVYSPPVLLLDEPLSNLDAKLRDEAKAWLRALIVDTGLSAIMVTHDQTEAMAIADRVVLLRDGRIAQEGTPVDIYREPENLFAAEFFGSTTRLTGALSAPDAIDVEGLLLHGVTRGSVATNQSAVAVVRTEKLSILSTPGPNRIPSHRLHSMFVGVQWEHHFQAGAQTVRAWGPELLTETIYYIEVPPEDLWIFPAERPVS